MAKKLTFKEFEERSNKVHNGKYIYHEDTYISTKKNTTITCPIHGDFPQTPKRHMIGQGCPECGKEYARTYRKHNYQPFLDEAHKRFGDDFSFPQIEQQYVNNKTHITVRCNKCGYEFPRRPNDLLSDKFNGCKNCKHIEALERKKKKIEEQKANKKSYTKQPIVSKEEYLERFRNKFGDDITPLMDEYIDTQKEIYFKCNKCGYIFKRRPHNCLRSKGCPKCKNQHNQKLTLDQFKERGNRVHNFKYDYSESEYIDTDTRLKVICHEKDEFGDEHGEFWVTPHAHIGMMKSGCPKCSGKFRKDTEYFIKQARRVHGDKYIYNNTHYIKALEDVEVICPIHGSFWLTPNDHLNGKGCKKCGYKTVSEKLSIPFEEFEKKAKIVHNNKYTYIKNSFVNFSTDTEIVCPIHGKFPQTPTSHLRGKGCPKCKQSHLENEIMSFLIEKELDFETQKKFKWLGKRSLDFYLPKYNIAIECQGMQHFKDTMFGHFEDILKKDILKKKLCEENGVKLLYYSNLGIEYPYEVFEDKEKLLEEILKSENFNISLQKV